MSNSQPPMDAAGERSPPQDPQSTIETTMENLSLADSSASMEAATEAPPPQRRKPASLMDLPAELRVMIYEYALPSRTSLSIRTDLAGEKISSDPSHCSRFTHLNKNALLRANRTIHNEALKIYYKNNHFHRSVDALMPPSTTPFSPYMHLMQHITIDFNFNIVHHQHAWDPAHIDSTISSQLQTIAANCHQAQIFELQLISSPTDWQWDVEIQGAILNSPSIPLVLAAVAAKVRHRVSIWSIDDGLIQHWTRAPNDPWRLLRAAVAGGEYWTLHCRMLSGPSVAGVDSDDEAIEWRGMMGCVSKAEGRRIESEPKVAEVE